MSRLNRRKFIETSLLAAAGTTFLFLPRSAKAADSAIEILLGEPISTINPNIYGHFVKDLGAVVYDGIWVGENSKIPNYDGIRKEFTFENPSSVKPRSEVVTGTNSFRFAPASVTQLTINLA